MVIRLSGGCSEIYKEKCFVESGFKPNHDLQQKKLGETSLMFLVHPTINESQMHRYAETVKNSFEGY